MKSFSDFGKQLNEAKATYTIKDSEGNIKHAGTDKDIAYKTHKSLNAKEPGHKLYKNGVSCLAEVLSKDDDAGEWISDFVKSDDPKFAGKSAAKRKEMALAAYYAKQNEEVDLEEAHKINDKVEIIKGSSKGTTGHIGEIRHGLYKGAPKTYTVYHGEHGAIQVSKEHIRKLKEDISIDEASRAETGELFKSLVDRAHASSEAGNHTQAKRHLANAQTARYGILAKHMNKHQASFDKYKELKHSYTNSDEPVREETLDELSKNTLGMYVKKAARDAAHKSAMAQAYSQNFDKSIDMDRIANRRKKGIDKAVNKLTSEEAEELDELSNKLLNRYSKKAEKEAGKNFMAADRAQDRGNYDKAQTHMDKADKRASGVYRAQSKIKEETMTEEHMVHVDTGEKYGKVSHPKDIEHVRSGIEKHGAIFAGNTDKGIVFKFKNAQSAIDFKNHTNKSPHKSMYADLTEAVQIDEISKDTLSSYAHKAFAQGNDLHQDLSYMRGNKATDAERKAIRDKISKRNSGVIKAAQKLNKEDMELNEDAYDTGYSHGGVGKPKSNPHTPGTKSHKHYEDGYDQGESDKETNEAVDTVKRDEKGKVIAWSHEGDWQKMSTKNKQGSGKAANLAGKAMQKTKQLSKEEVEELDEASIKLFMGKYQVWHKGQKVAAYNSKTDAQDHVNSLKEEVEEDINESAWGRDKMSSLRQAHDRHMEKALAANKAGDDTAVKTHQRKMQMIQGKMQKLKQNEEVELGEECEILLGEAAHTDVAVVKAKYKQNEDDNRHTENAELLAKHFGSKSDQNKVAKAKAYRDRNGGYSGDAEGRMHSNLAHEVHSKLYHHIKEEVEELDELSKGTLKSYVGKAVQSHGSNRVIANMAWDKSEKPGDLLDKLGHKSLKDSKKRSIGIAKAVDKLTKEEVEELDELSKATLGSYVKKAAGTAAGNARAAGNAMPTSQKMYGHENKVTKRLVGVSKAVSKLTKEEVEEFMQTEAYDQLDELDKKTLGNYVKKAHDQLLKHTGSVNMKFGRGDKDAVSYSLDKTALRKTANRNKGMDQAISRLTKEENLDELSKATLGSYINAAKADVYDNIRTGQDNNSSHLVAAANKQRNKGIKLATKRLSKEEVEELDELSKSTLGSYVKKASEQGKRAAVSANQSKHTASDAMDSGNSRLYDLHANNYRYSKNLEKKRDAGVDKAVNKLTKEDTMLTYSEFMAQLAESKADDLKDKLAADREARLNNYDYSKEKDTKKSPIQKVKGHSYGAGEEEGDDEEGTTKTVKPAAEKRGRGRPAGSKSGARV